MENTKAPCIFFLKHMTLKRFMNFTRAELNRMMKKEVLNSYPYILKMESTNICNLRCAYCYDGRRMPVQGERPYGRMTFENFKKLIDEVGLYLFKINLYGFGEPLLFPETLEMIQYASKNNIGIGISSNLNFTDADLPRRIVESGLEVLIFSCHGITQESYSKFMVKGDMSLAMENVKKIVDERKRLRISTPFIDWQYCVTKFNEGEMDLAVAKAKELGVDQIRFLRPFIPPDAENEWVDFFSKHELAGLQRSKAGCAWPWDEQGVYSPAVKEACAGHTLLPPMPGTERCRGCFFMLHPSPTVISRSHRSCTCLPALEHHRHAAFMQRFNPGIPPKSVTAASLLRKTPALPPTLPVNEVFRLFADSPS